MQSAYQQLDNMEAEEVEAITQEAALLWREQQAIFKEMTTIQLQSKVAKVRLAWREAANGPADGPDSNGLPDDLAADAEVVQLRGQLATDEAAMARLQRGLTLALTLALTLTLTLTLTRTLTRRGCSATWTRRGARCSSCRPTSRRAWSRRAG